jgi:hypothetical protein
VSKPGKGDLDVGRCRSCGQPVHNETPVHVCSRCTRPGCPRCMPAGERQPCPECEEAETDEE